MAQRSSRSSKKTSRKQPELRTGGGRRAKAARTQAREAAGTRSTQAGPTIRMRPAGAPGLLATLLLAYLGVALIAAAGLWIERWDVLSYPDSLWLYAAFGFVAVASVLGRVAAKQGDADGWGAQALVVPLGLLTAERLLGPDCPDGGSCAAIGARGALGLVGSIVVVLVLAAAAWGLARMAYGRAVRNRPGQGRVRYATLLGSMLAGIVLIGAPIALLLGGLDILLRDTPKHVKAATEQVANHCFALGAAPNLEVRAAPQGIYSRWTTYAVRQAKESREGVKGAPLPGDWANLNGLHPYEATTTFSEEGDPVSVECRKVAPGSGTAAATDLASDAPETNPLDTINLGAQFFPQFYTQGPPTAEQLKTQAAKKKADAAADAKQAAAAEKAAAAAAKK